MKPDIYWWVPAAIAIGITLATMTQAHASSFDTNMNMLRVPVPPTAREQAEYDAEQRCINAVQFQDTLRKARREPLTLPVPIAENNLPECDELRMLMEGD